MFTQSKPVWARGRSEELNLFLEFTILLPERSETVRMTASTAYHLYGDGQFMAYGPARAGDGHFRVDEWPVRGLKALRVLVAGYYTSCFEYTLYPSFLNLEVLDAEGGVLIATGRDQIDCREYAPRLRFTDKAARQRVYTEVYDFARPDGAAQALEILPDPIYLPRRTLPCDNRIYPMAPVADFTMGQREVPEQLMPCGRSPFNNNIRYLKPGFGRWFEHEECNLFAETHALSFSNRRPAESGAIEAGTARLYALDCERGGLIELSCTVESDARAYLIFDELLTDGDVLPRRFNVLGAMRVDLPAGKRHFLSFEPNCFKYLKICVLSGSVKVDALALIEQAGVEIPGTRFADPQIQEIYDAAVNTYRQNATDIFMDCPTRERAGWLCDSFFTARCEYAFTGENNVETAFLENFLRSTGYRMNPNAPKGILPMLYPGDTDYIGKREYIINWNLWMIVELAEYARLRNGDPTLVAELKPTVCGILDALKPYENEFGLIEDMPGWVFVEWSRSNDADVTCGVNFPSNMLYAAAMEAAGCAYGEHRWLARAEEIRDAVRRLSFNGRYFVDNAVRRNGALVRTENTTETCQYYAFALKTATPERYPELWRLLTEEFGPERKQNNRHPDVPFSNAFIGNYLRLIALMDNGCHAQTLRELRGYFGFMVRENGALWEFDSTRGSCCHGFAAYAGVLLLQLRDVLGLGGD